MVVSTYAECVPLGCKVLPLLSFDETANALHCKTVITLPLKAADSFYD
jgi:hypothetical protein